MKDNFISFVYIIHIMLMYSDMGNLFVFDRVGMNKFFSHPAEINFDVFRDEIIILSHSKSISVLRTKLNLMLIN